MCKESYESHFKKIFNFSETTEYILPSKVFESSKWTIEEFQNKKKQLNDVKSMLGKYKLKVWSKHTANRDPAGFVIKKVSETVYPELLTQAWCKFYEIVCQFDVVPNHAIKEGVFKSFHLCEAPGAFVCSLNHYLVLNHPNIKWKWMANTLNPNYEGNELSQMIPDDRFIRYTLNDWYFGADFTGDILKYYNHLDILNHEFCSNKVSLVTADGSVDCMKDPGEQEKLVEYLHYAETVTALNILRPGGTFILKIFTMFEESTINLLYLLNCMFETVSVFKPCSSKSGNSEVYVVSLKYKGLEHMQHLESTISAFFIKHHLYNSKSMFCLQNLPDPFLEDVKKCIDFFMAMQKKTILDNIYHFENRIQENNFMMKSMIAQMYIDRYGLWPISKEDKIVPNTTVGDMWRVHPALDRAKFNCVSVASIIKKHLELDDLQILVGKSITKVKNSKFTHKDNLNKLANFRQKEFSNGLYSIVYTFLEGENEIINVNTFNIKIFHKFQRDFFITVRRALECNGNIILIGIPFVTHFLVGLLYILSNAFEKICFTKGVIILYQKKSDSGTNAKNFLAIIQSQFESLDKYNASCAETFDKDIVQVVPPYQFDENNALLNLIWNYNNHLFQPLSFSRPLTCFNINNRYI